MNKRNINIAMTCTGGELAPEFIKAMRGSERFNVTILAVDGNPNAIGQHFANDFRVVPMGDADDYIDTMLSLVKEFKLQAIIVGSDGEALALSVDRERFKEEGCAICCPDPEVLALLANKASTYERLAAAGVPHADFTTANSLSELQTNLLAFHERYGEMVIKPAISRGGRDVFLIRDDIENEQSYNGGREVHCTLAVFQAKYQKRMASLFPVVVMQRLYEPTYDIDVQTWQGKPVNVIPRRRHNPAGIPFEGSTISTDEKLLELGRKASTVFNLSWLLDVDVMCTKDGVPVVLEINPRMSGSCAASVHAGVPLFDNLMAFALGEEPVTFTPEDGTVVASYKSLRTVAAKEKCGAAS